MWTKESEHEMVTHISDVLAETFRGTQFHADLTAWVDSQPMPGQMELPIDPAQGLCFCEEVNSEFTSTAVPGADWGTWQEPPC